MSEKIIKYELTAYNFEELFIWEKNFRVKIQLLILYQYSLGKTTSEISASMGISKHTVWKTRYKYWECGLTGIYDKFFSEHKPKLSRKNLEVINTWMIIEKQETRRERFLICDDSSSELVKMHDEALSSRFDISHVVQRIGVDWISTLY